MPNFEQLGLSPSIAMMVEQAGYIHPTDIQSKSIPKIMEGNDVVSLAQTGTGKTFAFILPIIEKVDPSIDAIQALIVTPTRELALQVTSELQKLIHVKENLNVLAIYGGQDVEKQLAVLSKSIHIAVGTPGRLIDHMNRGTVDLSQVSILVLDEADQMLHIGFLSEVEKIISACTSPHQTLLFSATMPEEIKTLTASYMTNPQMIETKKLYKKADHIKQLAYFTTDRAKQQTLLEILRTHRPYLAMIFCRTQRRVTKLHQALTEKGFVCTELHGGLSQAKREEAMRAFRENEFQLLVATDVAARGLDVEGVTHVFNYDIPLDTDSYIHRIGRTGRAGMSGLAITLYTKAEMSKLVKIEKDLSATFAKRTLEQHQHSSSSEQRPQNRNRKQR
ncbi:DEAD/DEAH box helicase [Cytobacillus gottheilii]|uniref:DEAD/DEAH box helicase n=1 Tax=Cytobacillus gottheilii TaxID=859144 RepID=UPI0009BBCE0C|nr:DEAD/DEAH box helicase [Cytobacillus gottheilii]